MTPLTVACLTEMSIVGEYRIHLIKEVFPYAYV